MAKGHMHPSCHKIDSKAENKHVAKLPPKTQPTLSVPNTYKLILKVSAFLIGIPLIPRLAMH
jgi:hypothetical protein